MESVIGIEPMIRELQSLAVPLGYTPIWFLGWDLDPRPLGYEPSVITTSLPRDKLVEKIGFEPMTSSSQN